MLLYTKLYLLGIVMLTTLASLWIDKKVPYFPIEISRLAGPHGTVSNGIFKAGILALPLVSYAMDSGTEVSRSLILAWGGLAILALFDDTSYWAIHMLGVCVLGASAVTYCVYHFTIAKATILTVAGFFWMLRLLLKGFVVFAFEIPHDEWRLNMVMERFHAIMQQGEAACSYPLVTLTAFKIAGVGQWLVFFILSFLV
jgi:hypothetical protein